MPSHASDNPVTFTPIAALALRLAALREKLVQLGVDAFVQPTHDQFLSEYPPESAKRLQWLCGFSGSAGSLLVRTHWPEGQVGAALLTDGRYTLQATKQLDKVMFNVLDTAQYRPVSYLASQAQNARLGAYPWQHSVAEWRAMQAEAGVQLISLPVHPVDEIWTDRPAEPVAPVVAHPLEYAGESSADKCKRLATELAQQGADAAFIGLADGVNWLLNIRGSDIAFNPLMLGYALLYADGAVHLFTHERAGLAEALPAHVSVVALADFMAQPDAFFRGIHRLWLDPQAVVQGVYQAAMDAACHIIERPDITLLPKAIKNAVEIEGIRAAHRRDGRAVSAFIDWLRQQSPLPDELTVVAQLESFRQYYGEGLYRGPSFDTIAGSGANGAIIHYRADASTNRQLQPGELLLLDSGGQYPDGTTDITRTIALGAPDAEMKRRFTQVLKGHIALAMARFPVGTTGGQLDALARQYLWAEGLDYAHGTGHGVGAYLCVHEGPQRISKRGGDVALQPGMILSNEPGFYVAGRYGIRIENLVLVVEDETAEGFLRFETLTLASLDASLIEHGLLNASEKQWLTDYEAQVAENVQANSAV